MDAPGNNLDAALRLLDEADQALAASKSSQAIHALRSATAHAILDVAEQHEYAGEQLRRIADGVEALVTTIRTHVRACPGCSHGRHTEAPCMADATTSPPGTPDLFPPLLTGEPDDPRPAQR